MQCLNVLEHGRSVSGSEMSMALPAHTDNFLRSLGVPTPNLEWHCNYHRLKYWLIRQGLMGVTLRIGRASGSQLDNVDRAKRRVVSGEVPAQIGTACIRLCKSDSQPS